MARTSKASSEIPLTTAQALGSLIKSARDILRKDKGLNGDLDRLPLLTWVMFLKFLDDLEAQREQEAVLAGESFKAALEPPYRWRDWAARADGITGDELLSFVNSDECMRPDGTRGPGLFAYLRALTSSNGDDRRDVVATVFRGVDNRIRSGYLLRDILNKVAGIHFTSTEEVHTLGTLYESMLREMRDAAGDSGEFYTPRAVVKFMVEVTDPRLGETILDPACGTGGFLAETFNHLGEQVRTVEDRAVLQRASVFGGEAKPLPYLLAEMNLLLHGLDAPAIDPGNSLRFRLAEIGERDRVDVILTNPPFGGEEEKGVQANFPEDRQTSETALLFLQLVMRRLHREASAAVKPARAAVVVPNGVLFGDGVCARIKQDLLQDFNLHTIVRLPSGVFAPYTDIPANLVFFDRTGPTKEVWYYEHPLPDGRKKYTKTQALRFDEFGPCLEWWTNRAENEHSWRVPVEELVEGNYNLDRKNPRGYVDPEDVSPQKLVGEILKNERAVIARLMEVEEILGGEEVLADWPVVQLRDVVSEVARSEVLVPGVLYRQLGVRLWGIGAYERDPIDGGSTKYRTLSRVEQDDLVVNKIWARNGSVAVVQPELAGCYVSGEFPCFVPDRQRVLPAWLGWLTRTRGFWAQCDARSQGTSGKNRIKPQEFLSVEIPLPSLDEQRRVLGQIQKVEIAEQTHSQTTEELRALIHAMLERAFKGGW